MNLILRPALSTDAMLLSRLAEKTFRETFEKGNSAEDLDLFCRVTYSPEIQSRELMDPRHEIWVTEADGDLIAYFMLREGPAERGVMGPKPIELQRIYVDAKFHGKGIAKDLMAKAIERVCARGFETLWLGVWEHNRRALAYYAKHGFAEVSKHTFMLGKDPQRDLILARDLRVPKK